MYTLLKYLTLSIVFIVTLLITLPTQNIYFMIEKELKKQDVVISNEIFEQTLFGFTLTDAQLYVKGVNITTLENIDISLKGIRILSKDIGKAYTQLDVATQSIIIYFEPTQTSIRKYKIMLKNFTKVEKGKYKYEYKLF